MINHIDSLNGYSNVFNNNSKAITESKVVNNQPVSDVVSINSTGMMDKELEGVFNNVMGDLAANQSDFGSLHGGLDLDRVKALLSL